MKAQINFESIVVRKLDSKRQLEGLIAFNIAASGKLYPGMLVAIRLPDGTPLKDATLEVGVPGGPFPGTLSHLEFSDACEEYFFDHFGERGRSVRMSGNASFTAIDSFFGMSKSVLITMIEQEGRAW